MYGVRAPSAADSSSEPEFIVHKRILLADTKLEMPRELRDAGIQIRDMSSGTAFQFVFPSKEERDGFKREVRMPICVAVCVGVFGARISYRGAKISGVWLL